MQFLLNYQIKRKKDDAFVPRIARLKTMKLSVVKRKESHPATSNYEIINSRRSKGRSGWTRSTLLQGTKDQLLSQHSRQSQIRGRCFYDMRKRKCKHTYIVIYI